MNPQAAIIIAGLSLFFVGVFMSLYFSSGGNARRL
jgi:hypothetical protein